jgi:hypothetical protein
MAKRIEVDNRRRGEAWQFLIVHPHEHNGNRQWCCWDIKLDVLVVMFRSVTEALTRRPFKPPCLFRLPGPSYSRARKEQPTLLLENVP